MVSPPPFIPPAPRYWLPSLRGYPLRLETQLQLLHEQTLDVIGCQVRSLDETGRVARSIRRYERWINEDTVDGEQISALRFVEFPLVNPTILARRSYFEMGFCDSDLPEDYDLMLHAAAQPAPSLMPI